MPSAEKKAYKLLVKLNNVFFVQYYSDHFVSQWKNQRNKPFIHDLEGVLT